MGFIVSGILLCLSRGVLACKMLIYVDIGYPPRRACAQSNVTLVPG